MKNKKCISFLEMVFGTFLTSLAFGLCIIPQNFAAAGVTGIASIISQYTGYTLSQIVFTVNALFLIVGFCFIGKNFTIKTISSSLLFPIFLEIIIRWNITISLSSVGFVLLAGILLGSGTGLLFLSGASSGGFSILGVLLHNRFSIPVALTINLVDASVILIQVFQQTIIQTICGILVITISSYLVGKMLAKQNNVQFS
ncbi:MAG: YitT family protein [Bacillota bacterium]|nr:YitT family protein [Bacillota bacterium]